MWLPRNGTGAVRNCEPIGWPISTVKLLLPTILSPRLAKVWLVIQGDLFMEVL